MIIEHVHNQTIYLCYAIVTFFFEPSLLCGGYSRVTNLMFLPFFVLPHKHFCKYYATMRDQCASSLQFGFKSICSHLKSIKFGLKSNPDSRGRKLLSFRVDLKNVHVPEQITSGYSMSEVYFGIEWLGGNI